MASLDVKLISLAALKMPTLEEHRAASLQWLERVGPTLIDRWPEPIAKLSPPTKFVPLDPALALKWWFGHELDHEASAPLVEEMDRLMGWERHFLRLNSRSPKDSAYPGLPVTCSGKEAVLTLATSERVLDDLTEFKYITDLAPAYICLREFDPRIQSDREFRCFVKSRELIAVSRYDYLNENDLLDGDGSGLRRRLDRWFADKLEPHLHVDDVVFDVAATHQGFVLVELNPYGLSDPCCFTTYANVEAASEPIALERMPA